MPTPELKPETVVHFKFRIDHTERMIRNMALAEEYASADMVHYEATGDRRRAQLLRELAAGIREDVSALQVLLELAKSEVRRAGG